LASARVTLLSPEQIASRLDDSLGLLVAGKRLAPVRQETMRATLDWSYALLPELERALFERLSVFAGDFTIEAVEAIAPTAEPPGDNTLALLGRLVDSGMVAAETAGSVSMRYRLLETLKQYGTERLRERARVDAVRSEHAAYYLRLAEEIEPDLSSPRVQSAQIRLAAEHDNFRAALGWLLERADVDRAQRLAGALGRFWFFSGHLSEADLWLTAR
jgi:non-specific serine/threonine protein kinase